MNTAHLEALQAQYEASALRARQRRMESRSRREYIARQPKRLLMLDAVFPPGSEGWVPGCGVFGKSLPREWVGGEFVTRQDVRRNS